MTRVLVLTPVYPTPSSPAEGVFNEQHVRALSAIGVDCTVIVCKQWLPDWLARFWNRYRFLAGLPKRETRGTVPVIYTRYAHVPGYRLIDWTVAACGKSIIRSVQDYTDGKFDLVHAHSVFPVGLAAPRVARYLSVPFLVTLHIEDSPQLYSSGAGRTTYQQMFRQAAALVAVGSPLERFVKRLMPVDAQTPVAVIPNGIDLDGIKRIVNTVGPHDDWGRIVSVANLWQLKGIDYNLRALAELDQRDIKRWQYTIVGDGPERATLESLARELDIFDRVQFIGRLPHDEAIRTMAQADIFSLPSWNEAFGVVYLEAMACGKIAIGCRGQGAEDIIQHERTSLLVEPRDVTTLAEALCRVLQDPTWARQLGIAGRDRAQEFTWTQNARRYLALYEKILSN